MPTVPPGSVSGLLMALMDALPRVPGVIYRDIKSAFQNPLELALRSPTALTMIVLISGVIEFSETAEWLVQHYRELIRVAWDEISRVIGFSISTSDRYALTFAILLALPAFVRGIRSKGEGDLEDDDAKNEARSALEAGVREEDSYDVMIRKFTRHAFRPIAPYIVSYAIAVTVMWFVAFRGQGTESLSIGVLIMLYISVVMSALYYKAAWQTLTCFLTLILFNYVALGFDWLIPRIGQGGG